MNFKFAFSFVIIFFMIFLKGYSQSFFKNIELSFTYLRQEQDRRLFQFPHGQEIIDREESNHDHEFRLLLNKDVYKTSKFIFSAGLGYSGYQAKFGRPFSLHYFGKRTYELRYVRKYNIHNLCLTNSVKYNLFKIKRNEVAFYLPVSLNIAFNKSINGTTGNWQEDKWKFDFNNLELYSGLSFKLDQFTIEAAYRIFNFQNIDEVIFNQTLFHASSQKHPFLTKKNETINLNKILFNLSYPF